MVSKKIKEEIQQLTDELNKSGYRVDFDRKKLKNTGSITISPKRKVSGLPNEKKVGRLLNLVGDIVARKVTATYTTSEIEKVKERLGFWGYDLKIQTNLKKIEIGPKERAFPIPSAADVRKLQEQVYRLTGSVPKVEITTPAIKKKITGTLYQELYKYLGEELERYGTMLPKNFMKTGFMKKAKLAEGILPEVKSQVEPLGIMPTGISPSSKSEVDLVFTGLQLLSKIGEGITEGVTKTSSYITDQRGASKYRKMFKKTDFDPNIHIKFNYGKHRGQFISLKDLKKIARDYKKG